MYLPLAAQLADPFKRIAANDHEVEHINARALPRGTDVLRSVELVARGFDGWVKNSVDAPRLTKRLRLPTFERDVDHPFLWPPPPYSQRGFREQERTGHVAIWRNLRA